jgi:hypothetical protein
MKRVLLSCFLMAMLVFPLVFIQGCAEEKPEVKPRGKPVSFSNADVGKTVTKVEEIAKGVKEKDAKMTYLKTPSFEVPSDQWYFDWKFETKPKVPAFAVGFNVRAYPEGENIEEIGSARAVSHSSSGRNYFYQGNGRYYLKIRTRLLKDWKINIRPWALDPLAPPLTLKGKSTANTQPFTIKADEARISYVIEGMPSLVGKTGGGAIDIYRVGDTDYIKRFVANPDNPGKGTFPGPGEFYIKVEAGGSWKIDITE